MKTIWTGWLPDNHIVVIFDMVVTLLTAALIIALASDISLAQCINGKCR